MSSHSVDYCYYFVNYIWCLRLESFAIGLYEDKTEIIHENLAPVHQNTGDEESQLLEQPSSKQLPQSNNSTVTQRERLLASSDDKRLKEILLWTSFYKDPYYGLWHYGHSGLIKHKFRINTCTTTSDRQRQHGAATVVVHARNPDTKPLPNSQNPKQIFVFFLHKALPACFFSDRYTIPAEDKTLFNLTITYRYDSDFVRPGVDKILRKDFPTNIPNLTVRARSRSVVRVASHCRTPSKREMYIKALAKYTDKQVMKDEWLYREFFTWKAFYRRVDVPIASVMCELCEKLHDPEYHKQ